MQMIPNKGETAVHGCHYQGDMTVRMRKVLARPWVGVCVPLALGLSFRIDHFRCIKIHTWLRGMGE